MKIINLPFGAAFDLDDFRAFTFSPLAKEDADLPNGYVHFKDGSNLPLLPGDALALAEYLKGMKDSVCLSVPKDFTLRMERIEKRQKEEQQNAEKRRAEEREKDTKKKEEEKKP